MKTVMLVVGVGLALLTGCAGNRPAYKTELLPDPAEQLDKWGAKYKTALLAHAAAKTSSELTQAIDSLVAAAVTAPIPEAQALAVKDACVAAAAAGDGATLSRFDCENGALKRVIGGK